MDLGQAILSALRNVPGFGMLATFQLIDIISGLAVAAGKGRWNSSISRRGLSRKVMMLCLFGCALAIEHWVPGAPPMSGLAAVLLSWGEVMSILENADDLGIWIPPTLKTWMRERRQLTQKQLDQVIAGFNPQINAEFVELTSHKVDSHADRIDQHASVVETKATSVIVKKNDSAPTLNVQKEPDVG